MILLIVNEKSSSISDIYKCQVLAVQGVCPPNTTAATPIKCKRLSVVVTHLQTLMSGQKPTEPYEGVSKIFWTGDLERELQMVQLSAIRCNCIAIL
jgi:hypothetical protein